MKKILFLALGLLLSWFAHATTYYVSHEGNDSYAGTSPQQAWRSTNKVNVMMHTFRPGDRILFRRGHRFPGGLVVTVSGSSGQPITFGAYGSGPRPIINGFRHLKNWQSVGPQTWKTSYDSPRGRAYNLLVNHLPQPIGRYPNQDAAEGGYLTVDQGNGNKRLGSTSLRGKWGGADLVVRSRRWVLDRIPIASQQGTELTLASKPSYQVDPGFGFFIVNHRNTLDQQGEWAYHADKQAIYLHSSRDPNTQGVMTAHVAELFALQYVKHVVIEQLELWGAAQTAVLIRNSKDITLRRCRIFGSGQDGITLRHSERVQLSYNRLEDTNNNGISVQDGAHIEVADNTLVRTGMIAGMGKSGNNAYFAIQCITHHLNIHRNTIDQVGYVGIGFIGDYVNVQYNVVTNFCQYKDDGGGIYTWAGTQHPHRMVQIKNNIIGHGGSATVSLGTSFTQLTHVSGIYLDNYTNGVDITDNTVYHCGNNGIYFHNAYNSTAKRNTLYNNRRALAFSQDDVVPNTYVRNIVAEDNVLFARRAGQELLHLHSVDDQQFHFGRIDRNYYYSPLQHERIIRSSDRNHRSTLYNLGQWQRASPYDDASHLDGRRWPTYLVKRYLSDNLLANANFHQGTQGWRYWSSRGNGQISHAQSSLDGGSMTIRFTAGAGNSRMSVSPISGMGPVEKHERYLLRYSLASSGNHTKLDTRITPRRGAYQSASNVHYASPRTQRQEIEAFFDINQSLPDAVVKFGVSENDQQIYVDNARLHKVETQAVNYNDYVQFVVNKTAGKKTFSLPPGEWWSVRGQAYRGSVTLERARSLVLLRRNTEAASRQAKPIAKSKTVAIAGETSSSLQVYPNPLYDGSLTVTLPPAGTSEVQIYDMTGQLLIQKTVNRQSSIKFPKKQLGRGVRLVKVVSGEQIEVQKIVVK